MQFRIAFLIGLSLLGASGCFCHGGYPNGYYAPGPSVLPSQPSTGFPSGPYYQPGGTYTAPMNNGPVYVPGNPSGTTTPTTPSTPPTYDSSPSTNGNSPTFNPETPAGVPVPDDSTGFERGTQRPTLTPTTSSTSSPVEEEEQTPFSQSESRRSPQTQYDAGDSVVESESLFEPPSIRQTSSSSENEDDVQLANVSGRVRPVAYGHHPDFRWIQGVVDYDKESKSWFIMYDDQPLESDQFGGDLTLADHPLLSRLKPGDVVRIEGTLDSEEDSRGKPVYQMTRVNKI